MYFSNVPAFRITTKAACKLDLHNFPLDSHKCVLELQSCESVLVTISSFQQIINRYLCKVNKERFQGKITFWLYRLRS